MYNINFLLIFISLFLCTHTVYMEYEICSYEDFKHLLNHWYLPSRCQWLSLQDFSLTDSDVIFLSQAAISKTGLKGQRIEPASIEYIDLSRNGFGDQGAIAIASILSYQRKIKLLAIGGNRFGDEGVSALAQSIGKHEFLEELYMESTNISDNALIILAEAILENVSLKKLVLDYCLISYKALNILRKFVAERQRRGRILLVSHAGYAVRNLIKKLKCRSFSPLSRISSILTK